MVVATYHQALPQQIYQYVNQSLNQEPKYLVAGKSLVVLAAVVDVLNVSLSVFKYAVELSELYHQDIYQYSALSDIHTAELLAVDRLLVVLATVADVENVNLLETAFSVYGQYHHKKYQYIADTTYWLTIDIAHEPSLYLTLDIDGAVQKGV